jgi:aminopeptidase YwaD
MATDLAAAELTRAGFDVARPSFACIAWTDGGARLYAGGEAYPVFVSPFSPACEAEARLVVASSLEELEGLDAAGRILLVRGELTREQLLPKSFPFYKSESHQHLIATLEGKAPLAIIAATGRDPSLAGGLSPFPLIEDGDVLVPSVYMTEADGDRLAGAVGEPVRLSIRSERSDSHGCNVVGRKGSGDRLLSLLAHIDSKPGSPGALDNASGVVTLLLVADLLRGTSPRSTVEIVLVNGEDYYSNPGEVRFLEDVADRWGDVVLGINLDGVGFDGEPTEYSLYQCPEGVAESVRERFRNMDGALEGLPWFQGDHALFVQQGVPALAVTSGSTRRQVMDVVHTAEDQPGLISCERIVGLAHTLAGLVQDLDHSSAGGGLPSDG